MSSLLNELVSSMEVTKAAVTLENIGTLVHARGAGSSWGHSDRAGVVQGVSTVDAAVHAAEWPASLDYQARGRVERYARVTPIRFGNIAVGFLEIEWDRAPRDERACIQRCQEFASACARFMLRHDTRSWAREQFDQDLFLVGLSSQLCEVEMAVVRAAQTSLPLLLRGEYGTELSAAALTFHRASAQHEGPFVELHCPSIVPDEFIATVSSSFEAASGGTLFLHGFESMPIAAQQGALRLLPARLTQSVGGGRRSGPRLVSSTSADIYALVESGHLLQSLVTELNVLSVQLPSVRERADDMPYLVRHLLHKHDFDPDLKCTEELMQVLVRHSWPGNLVELERALVQLSVMTGDAPIGVSDVGLHAPWLLGERELATAGAELAKVDARSQAWPEPARLTAEAPVEEWVRAMLDEDVERFAEVHAGLRRALMYIYANYQERIPLAKIAKHACLSTSHLSHLFKSTVGTNFKTLLARFRIERAKELLAPGERARRITDIAADTGFADLSHFEKTFRRFVDMCPSEYRKQFAGRVLM